MYLSKKRGGLRSVGRQQLGVLLRGTQGIISVPQAAKLLGVTQPVAAKNLARWEKNGWLARIRRGVYVPLPMDLPVLSALDDVWVIVSKLYEPCYIGGWSSAEYWGFTEQIFRSILVLTTRMIRKREAIIADNPLVIRTIRKKAFFGTATVWRGGTKALVSDPSKTIVDILDVPRLAGGIRLAADILKSYWQSEKRKPEELITYGDGMNNSAIFKRLGFLAERMLDDPQELVEACRRRIRKGNSRLDPDLPAQRLITTWRLWVPSNWKNEKT